MSLLQEIQGALLDTNIGLGSILLKLRLIAHRLKIEALEDWVKFEIEGYPPHADLPDYRQLGISYTGSFSGPFGSGINNAPIPPYLIEKFAGKNWSEYHVRQSISGIDSLVASSEKGGSLQIEAANLILLLQGKVYEGYACNAIYGRVSTASLVEIQTAVRSRVLELTFKLESEVPNSKAISVNNDASVAPQSANNATSQITQIIYGNYTSISNSGDQANISVSIAKDDVNSVIESLTKAGFSPKDSKDFAAIISKEKPENESTPFGPKAKEWLATNLPKAVKGGWKMGVSIGMHLLEEAAKKYYGL